MAAHRLDLFWSTCLGGNFHSISISFCLSTRRPTPQPWTPFTWPPSVVRGGPSHSIRKHQTPLKACRNLFPPQRRICSHLWAKVAPQLCLSGALSSSLAAGQLCGRPARALRAALCSGAACVALRQACWWWTGHLEWPRTQEAAVAPRPPKLVVRPHSRRTNNEI